VTSFTSCRRLTIEWGHCDPAGIVFNPRFFEFFDASSWLLFEAALGVKAQELAATFDIVGIALVDASANFLKPVKFGDAVEIVSRVSEFRRTSFEVEHRLSVNSALAVEGSESRVWAVRDPSNPDKIKTAPIPAEVIARFS
jgi:4-hydroxybenzoyl-CoA thioesterase